MKTILHIEGKPLTLENLARKGQEVSFTLGESIYRFRVARLPDGTYLLEQETAPGIWQRFPGASWQAGKDTRRVQVGGLEAKIREASAAGGAHANEQALSPTAPMPGLVRQLLVKKGDKVSAGQPLAVMEAMKLQMTLNAGGDATVAELLVAVGDMIPEGTELVRLTPTDKKAA